MIQKLTDYTDLEYDLQYLIDSRKTFGPNHMNTPWGCEIWPDPDEEFGSFLDGNLRTPGKYLTAADAGSTTNEYIHKCVTARIAAMGKKFQHPDITGLQEDEFGEVEKRLSW